MQRIANPLKLRGMERIEMQRIANPLKLRGMELVEMQRIANPLCKNKTNAPAGRRTPPMVAEPAAAAAGGFCAAVRRGSCRTETVHGLYE